MMPALVQTIETALQSAFGNMTLVALLIMFFFLIGFLILRIDFKFALLFTAPMALAFVEIGWFPSIVGFLTWFFIIVYGGILFWKHFSEIGL